MTDLEAHVNQKGRKELVKQVRAKIKELGITYIYYQFVSVSRPRVQMNACSLIWRIRSL